MLETRAEASECNKEGVSYFDGKPLGLFWVLFVEQEAQYVAQAGLELRSSCLSLRRVLISATYHWRV